MAQPEITVDQITASPDFEGSAITNVDAITVSAESVSDFHDAAQLTGSIADARITESSVTQHEAALSIGGGQVTSAVASAVSATSATNATNAVNATNATNANDATEWDGAAKTVSTSGPSGGSDGDIWYQYE